MQCLVNQQTTFNVAIMLTFLDLSAAFDSIDHNTHRRRVVVYASN